MKYSVVSSAEFTYPDRFQYSSSSNFMDIFAARGGYASCQVLLRNLERPQITVDFLDLPDGVTPEIYTLRSVMVERNEGIPDKGHKPHWPERIAPFRVYDCLRTFDGSVDIEGNEKQGGLYIALKIAPDAKPGEIGRAHV